MTLATYSDLTAAIADFLDRDDMTDAVLARFIALAEAQIRRDVRDWRMERRAVATLSTRYEQLPADWVETVLITVDTPSGNVALDLLSSHVMQDRRLAAQDVPGCPITFAHIGGQIEVFPSPDQSYNAEIYYRAAIPALTPANNTNWLYEMAPDVYLYGALMQTAGYLVEDARIATWGALYGEAVRRINEASEAARFSGAGLKMQMKGI